MIKIREAVIVEGKYDKIKLSNFLDALIVVSVSIRIKSGLLLFAALQRSAASFCLPIRIIPVFRSEITLQTVSRKTGSNIFTYRISMAEKKEKKSLPKRENSVWKVFRTIF